MGWLQEQAARNRRARDNQARTQRDRDNAQRNLQQQVHDERIARENRTNNSTTNLLDAMDNGASIDDLFSDPGITDTGVVSNRPLDPKLQDIVDKGTGKVQPSSTPFEPAGFDDSNDPTFSDVAATGLDASSLADDIQRKYGDLAAESGRRGSQARSQIFQEGDPLMQSFVGSDAYAALKEDPTAIKDADIQQRLADAGIDINAVASGTVNDETGVRTYESVDFEMLDKYVQSRLNPLKGSGSAAADILANGGKPSQATLNIDPGAVSSSEAPPVPVIDPNNNRATVDFATKKV